MTLLYFPFLISTGLSLENEIVNMHSLTWSNKKIRIVLYTVTLPLHNMAAEQMDSVLI